MVNTIYTSPQKWPVTTRIFHWLTVVFLGLTWFFVALQEATEDDSYTWLGWHKSFGVLVMFWTIARIINRFATVKQTPASINKSKQLIIVEKLTHLGLYVCLLVMPIAGILFSQAGGHAVSFFGLFDLPTFVEADRHLKKTFHTLHTDVIWVALLILTGLHIAAALYHQIIKKDGLMKRMM